MLAPKEVIPTIEDIYTVNTGSHDHCVHVYSRTNNEYIVCIVMITMASLIMYIIIFYC